MQNTHKIKSILGSRKFIPQSHSKWKNHVLVIVYNLHVRVNYIRGYKADQITCSLCSVTLFFRPSSVIQWIYVAKCIGALSGRIWDTNGLMPHFRLVSHIQPNIPKKIGPRHDQYYPEMDSLSFLRFMPGLIHWAPKKIRPNVSFGPSFAHSDKDSQRAGSQNWLRRSVFS